MIQPTFICLMAAARFLLQTEAQTSLDQKLYINQRTPYGSIKFGDIKKLHTSLCLESTFEYTITRLNLNKTTTKIGNYSKNVDPKNYLSSYKCGNNKDHFFACRRISKNYKPQNTQRWYRFHIENDLCNMNCIIVLSGESQSLDNKHFVDITFESNRSCERSSNDNITKTKSAEITRSSPMTKSIPTTPTSSTSKTSSLKATSKSTLKANTKSRFGSDSFLKNSTVQKITSVEDLLTTISSPNFETSETIFSPEDSPCLTATCGAKGNETKSKADSLNKVDMYILIIVAVALGFIIVILSTIICALVMTRRKSNDTGSLLLEEFFANSSTNMSAKIKASKKSTDEKQS